MAEIKTIHINLRPVQEYTGDRIKQVERFNRDVRNALSQSVHQSRETTLRALTTGLGMSGLAVVKARETVGGGRELFEKAEHRGEDMEHALISQVNERIHHLESQATEELRRLRTRMGDIPTPITINDQVDWAATRVRTLTGLKNSGESQTLPIPSYDHLTAKQIVSMLDELSVEALEKFRQYEAQGKARVTVLRAIDEKLKAKLAVA
jgi:hypothetical protein